MKALASFLFATLALPLTAAPVIGATTVAPSTATTGTSAQVTITSSITDSSLIAGSVNLLQMNPNGTPTPLGVLHDDGLNGDAYAGDGVYTLVCSLTATSPSQIVLQVSAAFRGLLQRVKSQPTAVTFQSATAPQQTLTTIAQYLAAGNSNAATAYVVPSAKWMTIIAFGPQALNTLASLLNSAVLVSSRNDLRVFQAPFVTQSGDTVTMEFTLIPGANGQWLLNTF